MIVVDASIVVDLLLDHETTAEPIWKRFRGARGQLAAPHLIDAEVTQVLRRFVLQHKLEAGRAMQAIEDFLALPITRYAHAPFLARAFALRDNVTAYDALYLVLAESLDAPLLTRDAALAHVPGHDAKVEIIA